MYYNYYIIIKYVDFKPIYCAINRYSASFFFINFNEFDYIFLLNKLLV